MSDKEAYNVVFRTAFDVSNYRNGKKSPVSPNYVRTNQYIQGMKSIIEVAPYLFEQNCILIDNTISKTEYIPYSFRQIIPKNVQIYASETNFFGRWNKGAGDVETMRKVIKLKKLEEKPVLVIELRLTYLNGYFFELFAENPISTILENKKGNSSLSGYFGLNYRDFEEFYTRISPLKMTLRKISIEDILLSTAKKNKWRVLTENCYALRHNPLNGLECY